MRVSRLAHLFAVAAAGLFSQQALAYTISVLPDGMLSPTGYGTVVTFDEPGVTAETFGVTTPYRDSEPGRGELLRIGRHHEQPDSGLGRPVRRALRRQHQLHGRARRRHRNDRLFRAQDQLRALLGLGRLPTTPCNSYDGSTLEATITGANVSPLLANGGQSGYASNGYVLISGLPAFTSVVATSSSNSFEFDNVVATPEPSTWAMLGIGFVGLASFATRRGRKDRLAPGLA